MQQPIAWLGTWFRNAGFYGVVTIVCRVLSVRCLGLVLDIAEGLWGLNTQIAGSYGVATRGSEVQGDLVWLPNGP